MSNEPTDAIRREFHELMQPIRRRNAAAHAKRVQTRRDAQRVYFAVAGDLIKIGISLNPQGRLAQLRIGNPSISLFGVVAGGLQLERELHREFAPFRVDGEWFLFTETIRQRIASLTETQR